MKDGLYKAAFSTSRGGVTQAEGTGVVVVAGENFRGGDGCFAYSGTLRTQEEVLIAELRVFRHSEGGPSVFGMDDVTATLTGDQQSGGATLSGVAPQVPDAKFVVALTPLE